jgi:hypothetical protein
MFLGIQYTLVNTPRGEELISRWRFFANIYLMM